jgi:DNA adenine methylase
MISANRERADVVFFVDPPYTAGNGKRAGARLYNHFEVDHERIFALMEQVRGDFLMTYDNDEYVRDMAARHHFECAPVAMTNTHHAEMNELLIGRDLGWFLR